MTTGARILIADDNPENLDILGTRLAAHGYETLTATDGPEAFRHVPTELVSGRLLTWYGPSLLEAAHTLRRD